MVTPTYHMLGGQDELGPYGPQRQRKSPMRTYYYDLRKLHETRLIKKSYDQRFNCLSIIEEQPTYILKSLTFLFSPALYVSYKNYQSWLWVFIWVGVWEMIPPSRSEVMPRPSVGGKVGGWVGGKVGPILTSLSDTPHCTTPYNLGRLPTYFA